MAHLEEAVRQQGRPLEHEDGLAELFQGVRLWVLGALSLVHRLERAIDEFF